MPGVHRGKALTGLEDTVWSLCKSPITEPWNYLGVRGSTPSCKELCYEGQRRQIVVFVVKGVAGAILQLAAVMFKILKGLVSLVPGIHFPLIAINFPPHSLACVTNDQPAMEGVRRAEYGVILAASKIVSRRESPSGSDQKTKSINECK